MKGCYRPQVGTGTLIRVRPRFREVEPKNLFLCLLLILTQATEKIFWIIFWPINDQLTISIYGNSAQSDAACARAGFRTQSLVANNVRYAAIALDSSDTPHVAYTQEIFDAGLDEFRIPLSYVQLQSGQALAPQLLEEGTRTFFFNDAYRVAIAIDPSDLVHLAHKVNAPPVAEKI